MKYKCSTNADNAGKPFWPAYSVYLKGKTVNTLVCQIDVQVQINVQGEKFFKNIKRAGQNRRAGGTFSGKSINVQGKNL